MPASPTHTFPDKRPAGLPDERSAGAGAIDPGLSLYLDFWRGLAACAVVLCHFGSRRMSGGVLWQLTPYGAEAVDVFFVLSGYVIAAAARTRETDARSFALSRLARLWSVAVPALIVTLALGAAGRRIFPDAYASLPGMAAHWPVLVQAASGLLFFNQAWTLDIPVGVNVPWWSLGYEAPYYLAFGLWRFGRGRLRVAGPLLVALLAGPAVALLGVLWIAGAVVGKRHASGGAGRGLAPGVAPRGLAFALVPISVWLGFEAICFFTGRPFGLVPGFRPELLQDLIVGLLFATHLLGAPALLRRLPRCPVLLARTIRAGAATSFALYLFHYPVMLFLRAIMLRAAPGLSPFWLLPATVALCLVAAQATERRKAAWRKRLSDVWGQISPSS